MRNRMWWMCTVALVLVGAVWPWAVQSQEDDLAETIRKSEAMVVEVKDFAGDARFNETDVVSLIELWDEYSDFGQMEEDEEWD